MVVEDVPALANLIAIEPATLTVAGVEEELAGGVPAEEIVEAVAVEVAGGEDDVKDIPSLSHLLGFVP